VARADQPVDVAVRPGAEPTAFVVERPGRVRLLGADHRPGRVVLDISDDTEAQGERGLLGLTFSPDGSFAYVNYTTNGGDTNIDEYRVDGSGTFDPASRRPVYAIEQPYGNHNGGDLATGPDGLLYLFTGDGGSAADPERVALDLTSPLGKVLRIDPTPSGGRSFTVPDDNPFVDVAGALGEIWAVGLRNPWRAAFDTVTGDLWIADVGQNEWEEVSVAWATAGRSAGRGLSFGWSAFEGTHRFNEDQPEQHHTPPVFEYPHGELGCSVSGGVRYRGSAVAGLEGWYVFADWCSGLVRALEVRTDGTAGRVVDLGTVPAAVAVVADARGELLVLSLDGDIVPVVPA
jgi:glucose/arabinose dehydrogenase